ncbi:MAG: hypothetical protein QNK37_03400 [Acidobacteriota bacterium]|nr:hypothetical protein [Acidobacteriota bacterium]
MRTLSLETARAKALYKAALHAGGLADAFVHLITQNMILDLFHRLKEQYTGDTVKAYLAAISTHLRSAVTMRKATRNPVEVITALKLWP